MKTTATMASLPTESDEAEKLTNLVHSLAREIFDAIYDLVFTPEPGRVLIDRWYRPPRRLQLDRASRRLFASRYYGSDSGFYFARTDEGILHRWLGGLCPTHRHISAGWTCLARKASSIIISSTN